MVQPPREDAIVVLARVLDNRHDVLDSFVSRGILNILPDHFPDPLTDPLELLLLVLRLGVSSAFPLLTPPPTHVI